MLCIVGRLAASLVSTPYVSTVLLRPSCHNQNCLQTSPSVLRGIDAPPLKTNILDFRFLIKKPECIEMFFTFQVQRLMSQFVSLFAKERKGKERGEEKKKKEENL